MHYLVLLRGMIQILFTIYCVEGPLQRVHESMKIHIGSKMFLICPLVAPTVGGGLQMTPHRVNVSVVKQKGDIFTILRSRTQTEYSDIYSLHAA